jgi:hypothetical protein
MLIIVPNQFTANADQYLTRFKWEDARFPRRKSLRELVDLVHAVSIQSLYIIFRTILIDTSVKLVGRLFKKYPIII